MDRQNVVIYCRVSTKEQAEEGNSLITQEKICREFADRCGFFVSKIFIEFGESAKTANRTELQHMLEYCSKKQNKITTVIVYKIDRLARNVDDYSDIRMRLKDYGIVIRSTSEQFDGNPAGRFMENILANVAQFDNDVRTERSVNGMKEAVRSGRYIWPAPYGYKNGLLLGKSNIIPDPSKSRFVRKAFTLIIEGQIAVEKIWLNLYKEGLTLSRSQFYKMIRNKMYCGIIEKFGEINIGKYEPLISTEIFEMASYTLKNPRRLIIPYNTNNPDFPLRRFVTHPSGIKLTGGWSKGKSGKKFPYYRYALNNNNFRKELLEEKFCLFMNSFVFDRQYLLTLREQTQMLFKQKMAIETESENRRNEYLADLKNKQSQILNKNLKGFISDEVLKIEIEKIETEIFNLTRQSIIPSKKLDTSNVNELFRCIEDFLINPGKCWEQVDFQLKTQLQVFKFPKGVWFDGQEFRTPEVSLLYKANDKFRLKKSYVVPHRSQKLNTPQIPKLPSPHVLLNTILPEFMRLKEIFDNPNKPMDDYPF